MDKYHNEKSNSFPVSDAEYAEGLQFQEALMESVIISQIKNNSYPPLPAAHTHNLSGKKSIEIGQSSQSFCEICAERKETNEMFPTESCIHSFCSECIGKYVVSKIQESNTIFTCPGSNCKAVLELDICRTKLAKRVIDLWEEALCKETTNQWQKFYCPFKDCSAMLLNDNINNGEKAVMRECECPFCHRLFCAECNVPWHSGVECGVFQRLNEDERKREDLMVMELAKQEKWSRCPKCRFYVERIEGCSHMVCRIRPEYDFNSSIMKLELYIDYTIRVILNCRTVMDAD
ncbi:E3 ubiquitin-protein ligase RSL1-like [Mercurialis annua]|uniref:E3 ubiquitin-protein ligase RSL1-like n=1 Tax=Mercurialis annua TaxID=3986 RepID=UPI00216043A8|nr:E3 ubiquitin-protein ligase RSL1-like [Mercurialis annua]